MRFFSPAIPVAYLGLTCVAGCTLDLPGKEEATPPYFVPDEMFGPDKPVHIGATRNGVHAALHLGEYSGSLHEQLRYDEIRTMTSAGKWLILGPNIETGELIGLHHRWNNYSIVIAYNADDKVTSYVVRHEVTHDVQE